VAATLPNDLEKVMTKPKKTEPGKHHKGKEKNPDRDDEKARVGPIDPTPTGGPPPPCDGDNYDKRSVV
jgi:hypothetical protein